MNRKEIRQKIYQLANVTESKKFRQLFLEFASYSLKLEADLKAILDCLEAEPKAVAAVITLSTRTTSKVISLSDYTFNKKLVACQSAGDYVELMSDLNQEIVSNCKEYAQYFRSRTL